MRKLLFVHFCKTSSWTTNLHHCDGRVRERDGKSWELCNWNEDYDDDSVEIKHEHLRNPNSFLLSSFCARRFLQYFWVNFGAFGEWATERWVNDEQYASGWSILRSKTCLNLLQRSVIKRNVNATTWQAWKSFLMFAIVDPSFSFKCQTRYPNDAAFRMQFLSSIIWCLFNHDYSDQHVYYRNACKFLSESSNGVAQDWWWRSLLQVIALGAGEQSSNEVQNLNLNRLISMKKAKIRKMLKFLHVFATRPLVWQWYTINRWMELICVQRYQIWDRFSPKLGSQSNVDKAPGC